MENSARELSGDAEPQFGNSSAAAGKPHREWYSRGYLPHRDHPGLLQMITYRLADSLPASVLARMKRELPENDISRRDAERRRKIEEWLDAGHGSCILRDRTAADCVMDTWRRFAGERYDLIAWVVMPNHTHILIRVYEGISLGKIVQSWKSYTGRRIADYLGTPSPGSALLERRQVWMREYWDRYIRDEKHLWAAVEYIHQNPVKAALVRRAEDWIWSSAREFPGNAEFPGSAEPQLG